MICKKTLKECMEFYSKDILMSMMKDKGIEAEENMTRKDMCKKLADYMMQPKELELYFSCLFDDEAARLEHAIREDFANDSYEGSYVIPMLLCQAEYAFRSTEDPEMFWLPYDVADAYLNMQSEAFTEKRKSQAYFLSCLMAVDTFYGNIPLKTIAPLMKKSEEEIMKAIIALPKELCHYMVINGLLYHRDLYLEDYGLACEQKDVPYYIPDDEELEELGRWGYLPTRAEMRALVNHLITERKMDVESAEYVSMWIQKITAADGSIEDILEYLEDFGTLEAGEVPLDLVELLQVFRRNTRKLCNRGFTDMELSMAEPATILKQNQPIIFSIPYEENPQTPDVPFQ